MTRWAVAKPVSFGTVDNQGAGKQLLNGRRRSISRHLFRLLNISSLFFHANEYFKMTHFASIPNRMLRNYIMPALAFGVLDEIFLHFHRYSLDEKRHPGNRSAL